MMPLPHHLILGGQRSGKSRHAERLGRAWLASSSAHRVVVLATATASDDEMTARIRRHRLDRPAGFDTVEASHDLAAALQVLDSADCLVIVDCLTLWLTNWLMPQQGTADLAAWQAAREAFLRSLETASASVMCVSNEVGWGVIPMGREVRDFVDELGRLNQAVAERCGEVTLMVAGQPWTRPVA